MIIHATYLCCDPCHATFKHLREHFHECQALGGYEIFMSKIGGKTHNLINQSRLWLWRDYSNSNMTNVTLHKNIIKLWHWKNNNDHVLTHVVTHGQPCGETGDSAPGLTAAPWCSKSKTSCCRPWGGKGLGLICGKEWWLTDSMVGGWATPLKNMNESQLGWLFIPNIRGKSKKWQPNHQPV